MRKAEVFKIPHLSYGTNLVIIPSRQKKVNNCSTYNKSTLLNVYYLATFATITKHDPYNYLYINSIASHWVVIFPGGQKDSCNPKCFDCCEGFS